MSVPELECPCLRPGIEPFPLRAGEDPQIGLRDPTGVAPGVVALSMPAFMLVQMFDGSNRLIDIQAKYARMAGRLLFTEELTSLVKQLDEAWLLDTPRFRERYASVVEDYRSSGLRRMGAQKATGARNGSLNEHIDTLLAEAPDRPATGPLVGLIAPHLDWPRGRPCYAHAYSALAAECRARRFVVLGTNHFGRSTSVVATGNDYETPLGRFTVDRAFIENLEERVGQSLREHEFDHHAEHSVELQLPFVQHLAKSEACTLVPVLCPDPCGPTGTAPSDGNGPDLQVFATALRDAIREDPTDTFVIAAADLSHIGAQFGDEGPLTDDLLEQVATRDRAALDCLDQDGPEAFRRHLHDTGNPTRMCSAGCIYTAATALDGAVAHRLHYHQAADKTTQTCVTCTAYAFRAAS